MCELPDKQLIKYGWRQQFDQPTFRWECLIVTYCYRLFIEFIFIDFGRKIALK